MSEYFGVWKKGEPVEGIPAPLLNDAIRANNAILETYLNKEHIFSTGGVVANQIMHKQGSARMFSQASAPATRIDGSAFASTDLGSIWIDTDNNKIYTLTAITPTHTWTLISTEIIATLLAAARVFASTLGVTGNFAVNTDKFTVNAANGNTLAKGTLGVTGITTLLEKLIMSSKKITGIANSTASGDAVHLGQFSPIALVGAASSDTDSPITLPNGLQLAWGSGTVGANAEDTVTHGLSNVCFTAWAYPTSNDTQDNFQLKTYDFGATNFTVRSTTNPGTTYDWIAIGR